MSRSIECLCVDDKGKPSEIPAEKWVKEGQPYNITHVFVMMQQNKIQGCELAEYDISDCIPYNCYRLTRFAFTKEALSKLFEMIKDCSGINNLEDVDILKLIGDTPKIITTNLH